MVRLLEEGDRAAIVPLLEEAPEQNLYILGNLQSLGFEVDYCQFWGDFGDTDCPPVELRAVLNRYMHGWALYAHSDADWPSLAQILDHHPVPAERLQDNPGGTETFLPYLQRYSAKKTTIEELMSLKVHDFKPAPQAAGYVFRRAVTSDLQRLCEFYADADHMSRTPQAVERPLRDTRIWIAERDGEILSSALTNAETAHLAMIGGVFTIPAWRGHGLSQAVCSALCREILTAGKRPILYWDTLAAGAVYRKLGFTRVGIWRSVWLTRNSE